MVSCNENTAKAVLDANVQYHNLIASHYDSDASTSMLYTKKAQNRFEEMAIFFRKETDGALWIDIGCGTGNILKFATRYFSKAIGFDISPEMLKLAQERGLDARQGNSDELPISSGTADVVSAVSVLHHLFDPAVTFSEAYRVLKRGGYFYSDHDPNGLSFLRKAYIKKTVRWLITLYERIMLQKISVLDSRIHSVGELQNLAEYHHNAGEDFNPRELAKKMSDIGFSKVSIFSSFGTLEPKRIIRNVSVPLALGYQIDPYFSIVAQK